jgi:3-deoxy-D-manno-octulosonate 8-phosphate phosphatase (KDO 8-P phosphatase)
MNILEHFANIRGFVLDVDGVLTDNSLFVSEEGHLLRTMNARDGYAMQLAIKKGYPLAIITGGRSEGVTKRLHGLGIKDVFVGVSDKLPVFENWLLCNGLEYDDVMYMGDDMPDIPPMQKAGLPCAPYDACPQVIQVARYVSPALGGKGCVRDVIEKVLTLQGNWGEGAVSG